MVPNGWETKNLGKLSIKIGSGVTPKGGSDSYKASGIPLIRSQNVLWGSLDLSDVAYIDDEQHKKMKGSIVYQNDVLLNITGASIGRVAISHLDEANVNQHVCIIRSETLHAEYLKSFLLSFYGQKQIEQFQAGGNRQGLNFEQIKSFKIPVPPLQEQRKIAQILSTWDRGIATTEKLIDASKQQKKALMQQLLTGKKRLVDPETGKAFEGEWEEVKLANICNKITDGAHHSPASVEEGFPMYSVKDMGKSGFKKGTARLISKEDYLYLEKQNCKPLINDILIAKDGSILKHCFVMEKQCDGVILSSIAILRPDLKKINPAFVAHFLSQDYVKKYVAKVFTTGSGVPRIVLKDFKSIKLKLGALAEQQKIASVLTAADEELKLLEAKLSHFKQEKKALMQQLLTGKRRVSLSS